MDDPTGAAPAPRVERFELRAGDCSGDSVSGDCAPRPLGDRIVTRARIERVLGFRAREGDEGTFKYALFVPPDEYTVVDSVGTTMGQLLWAFGGRGSYDSFPIHSFDTASNARGRVEIIQQEMRDNESQRLRSDAYTLGRIGDLLGQWLIMEVNYGLSSGTDGYLDARMNGQPLGRFRGRTMLDSGWLEVRYGIYQTGTNFFPGGAEAMPTQVAYFSDVSITRTT